MHTLYWSANSPYVRKILVAIQELNLSNEFNYVSAGDFILTGKGPSPISTQVELDQYNPAARIPTLLASDGSVYFGSQAIAQYLDLYAGGDKLFKSGKARMEDVMLESVADGLLDAALQLRYETTIRPENLRWEKWIIGWESKILRTLKALSPAKGIWKLPDPESPHIGIGGIAVASALWYLSVRFPDIHWKKDSALCEWYTAFTKRDSWVAALQARPAGLTP